MAHAPGSTELVEVSPVLFTHRRGACATDPSLIPPLPRGEQDIVVNAFLQAVWRRKPKAGLIFHSDRGSQYAANDFRGLLGQHGFIQSMSGKGNCYDNAVAESFFHTLKTEVIYHEKYLTRDHAKQSVFEYIEVFYNRVRKHSTLGYCSPWEFERKEKVA